MCSAGYIMSSIGVRPSHLTTYLLTLPWRISRIVLSTNYCSPFSFWFFLTLVSSEFSLFLFVQFLSWVFWFFLSMISSSVVWKHSSFIAVSHTGLLISPCRFSRYSVTSSRAFSVWGKGNTINWYIICYTVSIYDHLAWRNRDNSKWPDRLR